MFDYSFFALLFAIATTLAPAGADEVGFINVRHPEQRMTWTREGDGRWAMTMNERDIGRFERTGDAIFHHSDNRSPDRFLLNELLDPSALTRRATRIPLRGRFAPTVIHVDRDGEVTLRDPTGRLLRTDLRLTAR